ncbi:unnamed protein product [Cuscuta campestris]|uniref:Uncharacterized protein n=1 Tax=Cuscuta campestris TaxID=132261 RepID=A0A484M913_9ASTE|nr:unnamed protein product [Cuscuta campestris]
MLKYRNPKHLSMLNHLRFYLPKAYHRFFSIPSHLQLLHHKSSVGPLVFSVSFFSTKALEPNPVFYNYLIETLKFPKSKAHDASCRLPWIKSLEKPKSVVQYLRSIGFSDAHVQTLVRSAPQLLCVDVEKTLKPKIALLQELGLSGDDVGKFTSVQPYLLTCSLDSVIRPSIAFIKEFIRDESDNRNLFLVLRRCLWILSKRPEDMLLPNVQYLKSCGIAGSQLERLFRRQPRIFTMSLPMLKDLVSRVSDMGFSNNSKMFVHGLHSLSCISSETYTRKLELFKSYGFSEKECLSMFRKSPSVLRTSEDKLRLGIEFFLNRIEAGKSLLLARPSVLMFSMEERVFPRHQVLNLLMAKKLLKKEPSFANAIFLPEAEFLGKYIARFPAEAEELLMSYKGHLLV